MTAAPDTEAAVSRSSARARRRAHHGPRWHVSPQFLERQRRLKDVFSPDRLLNAGGAL
jgi:hypothetical protein